ncbi:MAG TPA: ABC transporter permease [Clostridia bacterium]|nr:ABC transporter permease [Clostridia bacterium]
MPPDIAGTGQTRRLHWRQVWILYCREMRSALRERTILFNSILIPVVLYPFLLWLASTGMMFVMGQTERFVSRVAVRDWPAAHPGLQRELKTNKKLELTVFKGNSEALRQAVVDGRVDAGLEFLPPTGPAAGLPGNFELRLLYDQSKDRSATAHQRVTERVERYREQWLDRESRERGIPPDQWQGFALEFHNVASQKQMGAFVLGLMVPIIFVVMVAVGCFYPAVDAIAGERERGTWETLMSTAATRTSIAMAKYLYVASMGGLAGVLNVVTLLLTLKPIFGPLFKNSGKSFDFSVPPELIPVLLIAAVLLAGFIAAGMLIFAAFARTFKEGQAMITPFYLLVMLPVVFLQVPGLKLTPLLALVPIVNITLLLREALGGAIPWGPAILTLAASAVLIAGCVYLASFILKFEEVVSGSQRGSIVAFIRQRLFQRPAAGPRTPKHTS